MKRARPILFAVLAAVVLPAGAASFDCGKAATRVEKAICADPKLGQLDADIAAAYAAAGAGLDDAMRQRLKRSQREWLAHRHAGEHLADNLTARLAVLRASRKTLGGLAFLDLASGGSRPMYLLTATAGTADYERWADSVWDADAGENTLEEGDLEQAKCEAEAKRSGERDECVVEGTEHVFRTSVPAPGFVSVQEWVSRDEHAAHPMNETHHASWWLARGRRLGAADLFAGDGWKAAIAQAVRRDARKQGGDASKEAVDSVCEPDAWWLTADGLVLEGDGETFGRGRGQVEITVPWRELRGVMRPELAAALGVR